jgi:NADPH:quinone reductase-like Zn-dependent oxidoreductase
MGTWTQGSQMSLPEVMAAALLTGHGGLDKLDYRTDVPVPRPGHREVLIEVTAAAINNTDINTRIGWYSKAVASDTNAGGRDGFSTITTADAAWSGKAMAFPRIQGADVCGRIAAVGEGVSEERIGERVLVRNMLRSYVGYRPFECWTLGGECDGGFAQFAVAPDRETHTVHSDWSDAELAAIPCAYSTAENMMHRAGVGAERVLVTGASGGVGLAAVQLAKRRGATVIAVCSPEKAADVLAEGADLTLERGADLVGALGPNSLDVVIDIVGGSQTTDLLDLLRQGGRYAVAGAIGGPVVEIDLRTVYLKDLSLLGCTFQDDEVFENLIGYIERNEVRPIVSKTYPLSEIAQAQQDFLTKKHTGKLVLLPPPVTPVTPTLDSTKTDAAQ